MYEIQFASIFRNSAGYMDRYVGQVRGILQIARMSRCVWLEGDSTDRTLELLQVHADELEKDFGTEVIIQKLDTGGPQWASVDAPARWRQLEMCWNTNIQQLADAEITVCVESDLIWEPDMLLRLSAQLKAGECDVIAPMLLMGEIFYDTNGFRRNGKKFTNGAPFIPDWNWLPLAECDSVGGLVIGRGEVMRTAYWADTCRLHFEPGTRVWTDTRERIEHPQP